MFALLDLDDTLVDKSRAFARWPRGFVDSGGLDEDALTWLMSTDQAIKRRGPFFAEVTNRWPELGSARALWDDYVQKMPLLVEPFPGVIEALHTLRRTGYRLVVVTNGRRENQEGKLKATGLADLVDDWTISEVVSHRKPAAEIYVAALETVGCPEPGQCWMIGDDRDLDIVPAAAAGLRTVWVSHGRRWYDANARPDLIAPTPADALAAIL